MLVFTLLGVVFLFLPGFLFSLVLFKDIDTAQRIAFTFGLTVILVVFFGFLLTGISYFTHTKTITTVSVWMVSSASSVFFGLIYFTQSLYGKNKNEKN